MSQDLRSKAIEIRDEQAEWANTANRIGSWMVQAEQEKADITNAQGLKVVYSENGEIPEVDLSGLAPKENESGDKVVYSKDGKIEIPKNVVTFTTGNDDDIYEANKDKIKRGFKFDNNGKIIAGTNDQSVLDKVRLKPKTRYKVIRNAVTTTNAALCLYPSAENTNVAVKITSNTLEWIFTTDSVNTYMSIWLVNSPEWNFENDLIILEIDSLDEQIIIGNDRIEIDSLKNAIYRKDILSDVTAKVLASVVNKDEYYIDNNGQLVPYNNPGIIRKYVDQYKVNKGDVATILASMAGNTLSYANVHVMSSKTELRVLLVNISSGKATFTVPQDNCFLRFYTLYNGGTVQPSNKYNIEESIHVSIDTKVTMIDGYAKTGDLVTGSSKNTTQQKVAIYTDIKAYPDTGANIGKVIVYDGLNVKMVMNKEGLLPNTDYVIDLGKSAKYYPAATYLYFYSKLPYDYALGGSYHNLADSRIPIAGRRYIHFSTKGTSIKYLTFLVSADNFTGGAIDNSATVSLAKVAIGQNIEFGDMRFSAKNIRIDHSDSEVADIPFPDWCNINLIGDNLSIKDKYNRIDMGFEYLDSNGNYFNGFGANAKQGTSTLNEAKMPLKTKLTNKFGKKFSFQFGNKFPRASWHLKSTPFDATVLRNSTMYLFVEELYNTKPFASRYPNSEPYNNSISDYRQRFNFEPLWTPKGIPCRLFMNGGFWGIYFLNYSDFCENYGVFENDADAFVYKGRSMWDRADLTGTWDLWEELKTDTYQKPDALAGEELWDDETKQPLMDLASWVSAANAATFKAEYENHFNLAWQIDYFLVCWFLNANDSFDNNQVLLTYDHQKFYNMFRDGDAWAGTGKDHAWTQPNANTMQYSTSCRLWNKFETSFSDQIKARYAELRNSGFFTAATMERILDKLDQFNYEHRIMDLVAWDYLTDKEAFRTSKGQIVDYITKRIVFLDGKFEYNG